MNNIQKAFKTKSKLRGMADGGQVDPRVLGSGMAQRAGSALQGRRAQLDAAIDAASGAPPPPSAPTPVTAAPAKKPEEKSALRSFFGLADGGQIFKNDVGGVPTFTDTRAATAGAKAYTPGQGGGTFSVVGMEPAQRQAAASAPTTLGKLNSPLATAGAPSSTPALRSGLDTTIGRTNGVTSSQTPATGAPANGVNRIMNSRDMSIFTPQEMKTFNAMGQAAMADAAQMQDVGLKAGQQTTDMGLSAATQPQFATPADDMAAPEQELADGGKVKGKGGPTDDKVGPVALSDGEYVLPADTVDIVGRNNLDALRLATHDFVDDSNKPKVSGLRKMANGGPFYVDPEGVASRQMPPGRAMVPYQPPTPSTAMAPQVIDAEFRNVSGAAGAANPAATSSLRTALNSGGGRAGSFARGALPVAAISGAVDSFADVGSGYRDKFNESVGATGPVSSVAGDAARVMGNVGDAITFGLAGRLGRGLSNLTSGQSFTEGFMSESDRDKYNREQMQRVMGQQAPAAAAAPQSRPGELPGMSNVPADVRTSSAGMPATPVQPQSYQSRRLAEMGVPVDQQNLAPVTEDTRRSLLREGSGTPGQYVNLGSHGGDANIYGTASKPGGRIDSFTGVGASARPGGGPQEDPIMGEIRSALRGLTDGAGNRGGASIGSGNAREINERYDKLANQLSSMYGPKGQGNLARRLLELEQSRSGALDADARNQSALRGQDVQASTVANTTNMQARMQALQTLGTMANQRSTQSAQAQAAQLKALQDAQTAARQGEEKGFERYTSAIGSMFVGPDGKPDAAEQERFTSFLQASDPQAQQKFAAMSPQDQMVLLQNFKTLYDMQKARNATAESGGGAITNRADMPVGVREATWNDHVNNNLPLGDYVWSNLPFTNPNVVVTESGQPVLMSDYATTDGNWDADKLEMIRQRTGKDREGRSALRGN